MLDLKSLKDNLICNVCKNKINIPIKEKQESQYYYKCNCFFESYSKNDCILLFVNQNIFEFYTIEYVMFGMNVVYSKNNGYCINPFVDHNIKLEIDLSILKTKSNKEDLIKDLQENINYIQKLRQNIIFF